MGPHVSNEGAMSRQTSARCGSWADFHCAKVAIVVYICLRVMRVQVALQGFSRIKSMTRFCFRVAVDFAEVRVALDVYSLSMSLQLAIFGKLSRLFLGKFTFSQDVWSSSPDVSQG
jgi:hypothetical protein